MQSPPNPDPTRTDNQNLHSAYLYLLTVSTAVTNLTAQTTYTKAYIHSLTRFPSASHSLHILPNIIERKKQLKAECRDLEMWEARLEQAGVGFVDWFVKVRTGKWLPGEILGMIGEGLKGREGEGTGLVLRDVWGLGLGMRGEYGI